MKAPTRDLGLACLSGVLLILAFPTFDLEVLAWVALVPLLTSLEGKGLKAAFLLATASGLVFATGIFYWNFWSVDEFNPLDYAVLAAYVSLVYGGLFGLGLNWVRQRTGLSQALIAPPLWVTLEYVRAHAGFLSAPWLLLGHSQYLHPALVQITSITGIYGLSFFIVLVNAAIAEAIVSRSSTGAYTARCVRGFPLPSQITASVFLIAVSLYGFHVLSDGTNGQTVRIAVIQENVPYDRKWTPTSRQMILDRYAALTRKAAQASPSLIVWPETSVPGDLLQDPDLKKNVSQLANEVKRYLLVGSAENRKFSGSKVAHRMYNSMVLFSPEGKIEGQYRKIKLVPFGEYEPFQGIIKWPKALVSTMDHYSAGEEFTLFTAGQATFGTTICWENTFPEFFREFVKRGARFMVNATDEGLFGATEASDQLLAINTFQAAMNRVALARSANMGIAAFIDPFGRITARLRGRERKDLFEEGILVTEVPLSERQTFYTRYGDIFAYLQILFCGLLLLHARMQGKIYTLNDAKVTE